MLDWQALEDTVAHEAIFQYQQLRNDYERRCFLQGLRVASQELYRLTSSADANYHHPQMGVAYSLWYHMQRVDNIYVALDAAHKIKPLPLRLRVLDMGAGTGSGTMAISFWLWRQFWSKTRFVGTLQCLRPNSANGFRKPWSAISVYQDCKVRSPILKPCLRHNLQALIL